MLYRDCTVVLVKREGGGYVSASGVRPIGGTRFIALVAIVASNEEYCGPMEIIPLLRFIHTH